MTGHVALIGCGPGDPELLTLRAARRIKQADAVVHDRLVGPGILALAAPRAELIDVGKAPGAGRSQELISALLVELARSGRRVARVKGGDPFVFGRGGEEASALAAAGVPYEVVPGISAAVAAPAAAGVPVTMRGLAASFTVVTGHRAPGEPDPDWAALAALGRSGSTLVVLMGVRHRAEIAADLIAGGLGPDTPVCAVRNASLPDQVVWRSTLGELGELEIANPATIVIGAVAALDFAPSTVAALATSAPAR